MLKRPRHLMNRHLPDHRNQANNLHRTMHKANRIDLEVNLIPPNRDLKDNMVAIPHKDILRDIRHNPIRHTGVDTGSLMANLCMVSRCINSSKVDDALAVEDLGCRLLPVSAVVYSVV